MKTMKSNQDEGTDNNESSKSKYSQFKFVLINVIGVSNLLPVGRIQPAKLVNYYFLLVLFVTAYNRNSYLFTKY